MPLPSLANFTCMALTIKQKHLSRDVPRKKFSKNMQQIYRRTPMPKSDFNKVAKQYWNHTLAYFSEHLFLRTPLGGCFCIYLKRCKKYDKFILTSLKLFPKECQNANTTPWKYQTIASCHNILINAMIWGKICTSLSSNKMQNHLLSE